MASRSTSDYFDSSFLVQWSIWNHDLPDKKGKHEVGVFTGRSTIESIQNVKLPLFTNFCVDKFQFAAFSSLISRKSAAVAVLKLQQNSN